MTWPWKSRDGADGSPASRSREEGYALVVTLLLLGAVAAAMLNFGQTARLHVRSVMVDVEVAAAEALADAGVTLAVLDLPAANPDGPRAFRFPRDRTPVTCSIEAGTITVAVGDVAGLVDLNFASERLLVALISGVRGDGADATRLAAAVLDYRDNDDDRRPGGAEAAEYLAAGMPSGPRNAPLVTTHELHRVLGFDRRLVEQLLPHVTVHSFLSGIDETAAPPRLVDMLVGTAVSAIAQGMARQPPDRGGIMRLPPEFRAISTKRAFDIVAEARIGRAAFARSAIAEASADNPTPRLVAWSRTDAGSLREARQPVVPCR